MPAYSGYSCKTSHNLSSGAVGAGFRWRHGIVTGNQRREGLVAVADRTQTGEQGAVTPELDALTCDVIGAYLDALAAGDDPGVVACIEDAAGHRSQVSFTDDGEEICLEAAQSHVSQAARQGYQPDGVSKAVRYAIAYLGYVCDDEALSGPAGNATEAYLDALLVSFGEKGAACGYSAYVLVRGIGEGDGFQWADPEPAGEEDLLV